MYPRKVIEKRVLKKEVKKKINQFLLMVIIYLLGAISVTKYPNMQSFIRKNIFEKSFNFMKVRNVYDKYFNISVEPSEEKPVFYDHFSYKSIEKQDRGVKLAVDKNYAVPMIEDGLIVYIGEMGGRSAIVVDQVDGVSVTYQNVQLKNHKIYDYLEKGDILGEVEEDILYIIFEKEGEEVSYQEYI